MFHYWIKLLPLNDNNITKRIYLILKEDADSNIIYYHARKFRISKSMAKPRNNRYALTYHKTTNTRPVLSKLV